jgi:histidinol-phosphatase (PHP family)
MDRKVGSVKGNDLLHLDILRDMHTHPFEKGRSLEAMEAFVLRAIELGLTAVAFTDHAPMDERLGAKHVMTMEEINRYYQFCRELQEKYSTVIEIIVGIEADYHPFNVSVIEKLKKNYHFDFVIGSLHLHTPPWAHAVDGLSAAALTEFSFKQSIDLVNCGLFDALAHFDRFRQVFDKLNYIFQPQELKEEFINLFTDVGKAGLILEINPHICNTRAGGSLEGLVEMIRWSEGCGLEYTIGSDAHWVKEMGFCFSELGDLLCCSEEVNRYETN